MWDVLFKSIMIKYGDPEEALKFVNIYVPLLWLILLLPRYSIMRRVAHFMPWFVLPIGLLYGIQFYAFVLQNPGAMDTLKDMATGVSVIWLTQSFGDALGAVAAWLHMCGGDLVVGQFVYMEGIKYKFPYLVHVVLMLLCLMFNPFGIVLFALYRSLFGVVESSQSTTKQKRN